MEGHHIDSRRKGSRWLSLLSVLMAARVDQMQVVIAERGDDGEWDFAFWNYDSDGIACTYRCGTGDSIWVPVETPDYSGNTRPCENPVDR